jgi:Domain of unknown function (DUF4388)
MAITGYLAEFSLAEIFQLLEQGSKTGLLSISALADVQADGHRNHHIWFNQGRIVAASNSLDQQGLVTMISQRGWMGNRAASRLAQSCPIGTPTGLCLKTQGVLNVEQLKMLFYAQVMRQVCALFGLKDGWFQFDNKAPIPATEMTGLSAPATEVTLAGLRALKDWTALSDKMPEPTSALISVIDGKPEIPINQCEWQVWEFTNGTVSLKVIANQLQLPIGKVQQIAFRLIVAGLAEEIPLLIETPSTTPEPEPLESSIPASEASGISQSFLQNLVGFLRSKV